MSNKSLFLVLAGAIFSLTACGDETESTAGSGGACKDYADVSGSASFELDVVPLFDQACNASGSCHSGSTPAEGLGLTANDAAERTALVAMLTSTQAKRSTMNLVTAGDPANSFLLVKCDNDADGIKECGEECSALGCGSAMPPTSALTDSELSILRRWIKDGAKDN